MNNIISKTEIKKEINSSSFLPAEEFTQEYFRVQDAQKPYEMLGIPENATSEQAKKAYHRLVKILHPDRLNDSNWERLANTAITKVTKAYENFISPASVLSEPETIRKTHVRKFDTDEEKLNYVISTITRMQPRQYNPCIFSALKWIHPISEAYRGNPNYQPRDGKPLPSLDDVIEALEKPEKGCPHDAFQVPSNSGSGVWTSANVWLFTFANCNHIPSEEEVKRKKLKEERIRKYGLTGRVLNFFV